MSNDPILGGTAPQKIEMGRADISELVRKLGKRLKADQADRRANGEEEPLKPLVMECIAYPCGWNHLGQATIVEVSTTTKVKGLDSYLRARGKDVDQAKWRMKWVMCKALIGIRQLSSEDARKIARRCVFFVVDTLQRRPPGME